MQKLNLDYSSYRHEYVLTQALKNSLVDDNYDFQSLFDIDNEEATGGPRTEWYELESPKVF